MSYPSIDSDTFIQDLLRKREFMFYFRKQFQKENIKTEKDYLRAIEAISDKYCSGTHKYPFSHQNILRNFISPHTPYKHLLLFHGTGSGKTLTSLLIAEQFKSNKKHIYVVAPTHILQQFTQSLFPSTLFSGANRYDFESLKWKMRLVRETLLRDTYYEEFIRLFRTRPDDLQGCIMDVLNKYYYVDKGTVGMTPHQFKKKIRSILTIDDEREKMQRLYREFHDSVIIMDEFHNIQNPDYDTFQEDEQDTDEEKLAVLLEKMFEYIQKSFLSKKSAIQVRLLLMTATPMVNKPSEICLPLRLMLLNEPRNEAVESKMKSLNENIHKKGVERLLEQLFRGRVSYFRSENPFYFPLRLYPEISQEPNVTAPYPTSEYSDLSFSFLKVYPTILSKKLSRYLLEHENITIKNQSKERQSMVFCNPDPAKTPSFAKNELPSYSPKLNTVLGLVDRAEGIVLIFCEFIKSGVNIMAQVLEANGYEKVVHPSSTFRDAKKRFCVLTGAVNDIVIRQFVDIINHENNKDGEVLKIVLITRKMQEGVDFKNVREIHLLTGWWNMAKLHQITGRGLRNCSHSALPFVKRNCSIYYHVNFFHPSVSTRETIDRYVYRVAEKKQIPISKIERVLQRVAIDCYLNQHDNYLDPDVFEDLPPLTIRNSQSQISARKLSDVDFSMACFYQKCDYRCLPRFQINEYIKEKFYLDENTFVRHFITSIHRIQDQIYDLFASQKRDMEYSEIRGAVRFENANEKRLFDVALYDMILRNTKIEPIGASLDTTLVPHHVGLRPWWMEKSVPYLKYQHLRADFPEFQHATLKKPKVEKINLQIIHDQVQALREKYGPRKFSDATLYEFAVDHLLSVSEREFLSSRIPDSETLIANALLVQSSAKEVKNTYGSYTANKSVKKFIFKGKDCMSYPKQELVGQTDIKIPGKYATRKSAACEYLELKLREKAKQGPDRYSFHRFS